jgi:hypothetical protein
MLGKTGFKVSKFQGFKVKNPVPHLRRAREGISLAKAVTNWHKKQLRLHRKGLTQE